MKKTEDRLLSYKSKRDFSVTPEPREEISKEKPQLSFVVQKHAARNLHYDLRLELDGVLKSWAVPKGPSLDPSQKRLAVEVEDHPLSYAEFEGVIPLGQYGAGTVIVWDHGNWEPIGDPKEGLAAGQLKFQLHGEKLKGAWVLIRMHAKSGEKQKPWLLIKEHDAYTRPETEFNVVESLPDSVLKKEGAPAIPAGATQGPFPPTFSPQLATLIDSVPSNGDWIYEVKLDGYRILARIDENEVALFTRNGFNWTAKLESLAVALKKLKIAPGWLDGEIVSLGADGMPDFGALQNAFESENTTGIRYYVFDMPFYAGFDLRNVGLAERRVLLEKVLNKSASSQVSFSEDFEARGSDILRSACRLGLEGIMGKRKDSPYVSGRSLSWIKLKCSQRQEFVVVGYTESKGPGRNIGALLLGVYDEASHLIYAGRVGTGFDNNTARALKEKLLPLAAEKSQLFDRPKDAEGNWVMPELVVEVSFAVWTKAGRLRHAVFHGLRSDKPAILITRETPVEMPPPDDDSHISNPERIIDSSTGTRKSDIVAYYQLAAQLILPYLADRPVTFLRAPSGIDGTIFFQKHADTLRILELRQLDPSFDPGHPPLMEIHSLAALIGAVEMNVVEFHTGNATTKNIEMPDRMVFDLDPGEGVGWKVMLEAAELTHTLLEELGLKSFLKTSGIKGLHIVVPLLPRDDWESVKDFSKAVSNHLANIIPSRFTAVSGPHNRVGKIFIDYIRNSRSATTVAPFSARAHPGMGVSMPCSWQELSALTGGSHWNISNVARRLESRGNPWENYAKIQQIIGAGAKKKLTK